MTARDIEIWSQAVREYLVELPFATEAKTIVLSNTLCANIGSAEWDLEQWVFEILPDQAESILESYGARNYAATRPYQEEFIRQPLDLTIECIVVDRDRLADFTEAGCSRFHDEFPDCAGWIETRLPGVSDHGTHAMFYLGHYCAYGGAQGICFVMEKYESSWLVIDKRRVW